MAPPGLMAGSNHLRPNALAAMLLTALLAGRVAPAAASEFSGGAGYDYQTGPGGETWSAPLGFAVIAGSRGDATVSLSRFQSSDVGRGWGGLVNAGVLIGSRVGARATAIRSVGDGDYRAWRAQAGPFLQIDDTHSVEAYVSRFDDSQGARLDQVGAEISFPLSDRVLGLAGAAFGDRQDGAASSQATAGVTWNAWKHLQLIGQATLGKNIAATSAAAGSAGSGGPLGSGPRGHAAQSGASAGSPLQGMALVGIRVVVP